MSTVDEPKVIINFEELHDVVYKTEVDDELRDRWKKLHTENVRLQVEYNKAANEFKVNQETQQSMSRKLKDKAKKITTLKIQAESEIKRLEGQLKENEEIYELRMQKIKDKHGNEVDQLAVERQTLRSRLTELNETANRKTKTEDRIAKLEHDLAKAKEDHKNTVITMEREKIQMIEKLKKDMVLKIKETKQNLLLLNDEQLHTTTRLTVLENHRLTTELNYQCRQTEKLIETNIELESLAAELKREIEIHHQVQSDLAKRTHLSQKTIKDLNAKLKELEDRLSPLDSKVLKYDQKDSEERVRGLEINLEKELNKLNSLQMTLNRLRDKQDYRRQANVRRQKGPFDWNMISGIMGPNQKNPAEQSAILEGSSHL
mmetsp:Transcript_21500/g.39326  ORF Transcript_21500/g.39326 Transcript_21500/m.39326 type:complete len:374 (+) Transcript_21500:11-1132(+)